MNKYRVELVVPTIEIHQVDSDIPLTRGEIVSRIGHRKPKSVEYGNSDYEITIIEGNIEDDK
tara:strand:+ start:482 stop:667 length:186 start_codon:yes stop_codon:yes gene_type:complete